MLDARAERTLTEVVTELRALCGERLIAVALYGSGAATDYVPGRSDLNLVVALDELDEPLLRAIRAHVRRWCKRGVATPLLLDRAFLRHAVDVFPMELHDIQERHRVLFGADLFADLPIEDRYLRYQCEHEARGKLLRLHELYLEIGSRRRALQHLVLDSVKTFLVILRTLNRLRRLPPARSDEEALQAFCRAFACELPVLARLLRIRLAKEKWSGDAEAEFHAYVQELHRLVRLIDQLAP
jgi:hypothetical protein